VFILAIGQLIGEVEPNNIIISTFYINVIFIIG
jgi:hypothetical protein